MWWNHFRHTLKLYNDQTNKFKQKGKVCENQKSGESGSYLAVMVLIFYGCSFQTWISDRLQRVYLQDATLEIRDLVVHFPLQHQVLENQHKLI
jgi:hypothetical protein